MGHPYWPLFDLRLRTERLEMRYPTDEECTQLAALAAKGIHDPGWMPFSQPWTEIPSPRLEQQAMQHYWEVRAKWSPADWTCFFVTLYDGEIIGTQDFFAKSFAILRGVSSGSWLGRAFQGNGFGKEQRAAMLHLAFEGLGALRADSAAREDNGPSLGVSRSLGYEEDGDYYQVVSGQRVRMVRIKLTRERWEATRTHEVKISGLEPCLELFGAGGSEPGPSS
ncbi:MAG TPA: GNAT family protein [Acidimicrobiales bacterium]|nr:GNAT family protein [Acidimicrobiales bacterium]